MEKIIRILVVDDEKNVLKSIEKVIRTRRPHAQIDLTDKPEKCLEMIKISKYDIMITDLVMPKIHGYELMRNVKQIDPDIKIIVITGIATMETFVESKEAGAINFIPKPFTRDELHGAIDLIL